VDIRDAVSVAGLLSAGGTPPLIRGVRLGDGSSIEADVVVVATGRRSTLPEWLAAVGSAEVPEESHDTGIMYLSRFYRLTSGAEFPPRVGPIGGDLGYLKYGVFVGDNRTFSITLAVPTDDLDLRQALSQADTFDLAASLLTATAPWIADGRADPLTDVHTMSGLINRERRFVVDGVPLAIGVHAVGDARLCTNPLYGRGCSTGFWSAHLLAQVVAAEPDDLAAQAVAFDRLIDDEIGPFYRSSVAQDREARRVARALLAGKNPDDADDPRSFMRSVFRDGLLPAMRTEPAVLRAFFRTFNLLSPPESLIADPEVSALVLAAWQQRDQRPPEPSLGPDRAGLLALLP
jgi:flavin-dependent dehydrogenase